MPSCSPYASSPRGIELLFCCASLLACSSFLGCGSTLGSALTSGVASAPAKALSLGPQLGYGWRSSDATLRPVLGVAGGAQVGQSVVPAKLYSTVATPVTGTSAVALGQDGNLYRVSLATGSATLLNSGSGAGFAGMTMRISPTGSSALLFTPGSTKATLVTGTGGATQTLSVSAESGVQDAAVSDAGSVALALASANGVVVEIKRPGGAAVSVTQLNQLGGLSFVASTDTLLLTDAAQDTLIEVQTASTAPSLQVLATNGLLKVPGSVGASADGNWAVVENSGEPSVVRVGLGAAASAVRLPCSCQPSTVQPLTNGTTFRITDLDHGPVWIINAEAVAPALRFVPAINGSTGPSADSVAQ